MVSAHEVFTGSLGGWTSCCPSFFRSTVAETHRWSCRTPHLSCGNPPLEWPKPPQLTQPFSWSSQGPNVNASRLSSTPPEVPRRRQGALGVRSGALRRFGRPQRFSRGPSTWRKDGGMVLTDASTLNRPVLDHGWDHF